MGLIEGLRSSGELGKVRSAREAMHAIFPLTDAMWTAWIADELRIRGRKEEELLEVCRY